MSFSRKGLWNNFWSGRDPEKEYVDCKDNNVTMLLSKEIFEKNKVNLIEDWGCGNCVFKEYVKNINYVGIDGSDTGYQNKIEDLTKYKTKVEGIYIRHVLEHNYDYKKILENALQSFEKILLLVLFTPFTSKEETNILSTCYLQGNNIPDIAFNKTHLINIINQNNCSYELIEKIKSKTSYGYENIFIIKH